MPFPPPGNLPNPGIEPKSLVSSALAGRFFTISVTCAVQPIVSWVSSIAPKKHDALTGFSQWNSPAPGGSLVATSWRELNFLMLLPFQDLETSKCEGPCLANYCLFLVYRMSCILIIIKKKSKSILPKWREEFNASSFVSTCSIIFVL